MRFAVITYIQHKNYKHNYYSYAPYVREMNMWFRQVDDVLVLAPVSNTSPDATELSYQADSLKFSRIPGLNFTGFYKGINSLLKLPFIGYSIFKMMRQSDHIHLRCPGNVSLIGCIIQIFFPSKPKTVKYAGNWDPDSSQPWSYRLQRAILRSPMLSRNMSVLVYGKWEKQSDNIIPFFTASFKESEKESLKKDFDQPLKFMFVGSLVAGKRPLVAIKLVEKLNANGVEAQLSLYGDGKLKDSLRDYIKKNQLGNTVSLAGKIPLEKLKQEYKRNHFVVLPSKSEGWPKALAEGMFFGCIPVATKVSCVPWMLKNGNRGILLNSYVCKSGSEDIEHNLADDAFYQIISLSENRAEMLRMSKAAKDWSEAYTLDRFEAEIEKLLLRPDR